MFQKRNTRYARCGTAGLRQGFACGDVAKPTPIVLATPPAQQLPSAVSFPALLLFPAGLGFCPVNQNSPTFDPSPPVMYMRNVTCDKELSEEQRVKAPVTAVPPSPWTEKISPDLLSSGASLPSALRSSPTESQTEKDRQQPGFLPMTPQ